MSGAIHTKRVRASLGRRLFGAVDEAPVDGVALRRLVWVRWLAITGLAVPLNFAFAPMMITTSYAPDVSRGLVVAGQILTALYVFFNVVAHWVLRGQHDALRVRIAYHATIGCALVEAGMFTVTQYGIGSLSLLQPTLGLGILVIYRIFCDYRSSLVVCVAIVGSFIVVGVLETGQMITISPFFDAPLNHPFFNWKWFGLGQLALASAQMLTFFALLNFVSNQRASLHRYMTEYVLQRYLPPEMVKRAAMGELTLEGPPEEREVTILFADLVGFTRLSQELGANGIASLLDHYLGAVADAAHELGGTVDKFIGDCVMVVFGAPQGMPLDRQAENAVRLALEIQEIAAEIGEGLELEARVGVNTGPVVVGNFGSGVRSDYTAIGHSVNLAARLETSGAPGRILVGAETRSLLDTSWLCESHGPLHLKGIEEPQVAFWVSKAEPSEQHED